MQPEKNENIQNENVLYEESKNLLKKLNEPLNSYEDFTKIFSIEEISKKQHDDFCKLYDGEEEYNQEWGHTFFCYYYYLSKHKIIDSIKRDFFLTKSKSEEKLYSLTTLEILDKLPNMILFLDRKILANKYIWLDTKIGEILYSMYGETTFGFLDKYFETNERITFNPFSYIINQEISKQLKKLRNTYKLDKKIWSK
ncbi:hypothetical protein ACWXVO_00205 [Mycoplasma sp. 1890]